MQRKWLSSFICFFISVFLSAPVSAAGREETLGEAWLIKLEEGVDVAVAVQRLGAEYVEPLEGVAGWHRVAFLRTKAARPEETDDLVLRQLSQSKEVIGYEPVRRVVMYPRRFEPADPLFGRQWHHENTGRGEAFAWADARVRPAWDRGLSGAGVVIGVVDTGTDYRHPDLVDNWLPGSGRDFVFDDDDPSPVNATDRHGTAVAGISVASSNRIGGLGIAYNAQFVPLYLINTDVGFDFGDDATALSHRIQDIDIYNNSWGPSDLGGPRYAGRSGPVRDALRENVRTGRGGLGNIYVWAAGNGGLNRDNSNYDGYNALPYTISVGALGDDNLKAGYSEPGANLLVVAPSGSRGEGILTTDNRGASGYSPGDYFDNFNGTSAAAPMVSGVVALMLEANPQLNWREVQVILARSAVPVDFFGSDWVRNGGGRWHSHDYGFGRVDAASATLLASQWRPLGPQREISLPQSNVFSALTPGVELSRSITVDIPGDLIIEHVLVDVTSTHPGWMDLQIELESPGGLRSVLAEAANAPTASNPGSWTYLSTRHLDETANGVWTLRITNARSTATGIWQNWRLRFYGRTPDGGANRAPLAEDIIIDSTEFPIVVDALAGVSDPDGDPVSILSIQRPRFGTMQDLGGGRYRFEMGISKDGQDAFGVLLGDGRGNVTRRIITVRDPRPVAVPDRFVVRSGSTHSFEVLANDMDPDGGALRITGVEGSVRGELEVVDGQAIRYTAAVGFSGVERFRYTLTDDTDGASSAWVTVVVQATMDVAMEFDGVDDYIEVPGTTAQWLRDRFTAEAWFFAQDYGEYVTGFGRIFDNESFLVFLNGLDHAFYNDRSIVVYVVTEGDGPVAINTPLNSVDLGRWHHVAVTYDSANSTQPVGIYLDGEPVVVEYPLEAEPPLRPVMSSSNFPLLIGESSSGARAFNGKIAELRIWDRVRSAAQIRAGHNIRMNGTEAGLQVYLPFDDIALDQTGNRAGAGFTADIFEARRVPRVAPWAGFEAAFAVSGGSESGWWEELLLGSIYGDAFPWIYWPSIGWAYAAHDFAEEGYMLHPVAPQRGWLYLQSDTYPWIWHAGIGKWIRLQVAEDGQAWFYEPEDIGWWGADEPLPLP